MTHRYLDVTRLEAISEEDFLATRPYPWINPEGLITDEGFRELLANMPDISMFEKKFGYARRAGQQPHDRYSLEYRPGMTVPGPWREFIGELRGDAYRDNMARLLGARKVEFRFHWHYTPSGCSVSPHVDAAREHGSHLFYFNSPQDWDPAWGGDTLVLDDGGRLSCDSAPALEDFENEIACQSVGNYSLIFKRGDHAWHAVREICCPAGRMRRVFIVVVNPDSLFWKLRDRVIGKQVQRL